MFKKLWDFLLRRPPAKSSADHARERMRAQAAVLNWRSNYPEIAKYWAEQQRKGGD